MLNGKPKKNSPSLDELLGTKDKTEQAERVQTLIQMVQAPVVDLLLRFDARTNEIGVTPVGVELPLHQIYSLLDAAKEMLRQKEIEALRQQAKNVSTSKEVVNE